MNTTATVKALWTSDDAARATGGTVTRPWAATGVSINTRTIKPGDLFVALKGPTFDGHDYVQAAFNDGAAAATVSKAVSTDKALLEVADTQVALEALGTNARKRAADVTLIAVTGSVGKTGVKEALAHVLTGQGATHASEGSLNNHWGLPLSLARMKADARYGVMEMGMNHAGELTSLSKMARPHVCVITTIQPAHTEYFNSLNDIADAKAEIFVGGEPGWTAVLNRDIEQFDRLEAAATAQGAGRIITFGVHNDADVRLLDSAAMDATSTVQAEIDGEAIAYAVGVAGHHWVINSLCVLATVLAAGADVAMAARALASLKAPVGRGQRFEVCINGDGGTFTIIDESYNASPASMAAALNVLAAENIKGTGRRIAALGDMLEMGADAARLHRELKSEIENAGVDVVYLAGAEMAHLKAELKPSVIGEYAKDADTIAHALKSAVRPGDVVMVKGSAGIKMGRVVETLKQMHTGERSAD